MKNIAKIGIIFMVALLVACQSEYDVIENGVFLPDAQKSQSKKVTIDDTGAKTVISSRLGTMMTTDVTVEYGTDAMALQAYNQKNAEYIKKKNPDKIIASVAGKILQFFGKYDNNQSW